MANLPRFSLPPAARRSIPTRRDRSPPSRSPAAIIPAVAFVSRRGAWRGVSCGRERKTAQNEEWQECEEWQAGRRVKREDLVILRASGGGGLVCVARVVRHQALIAEYAERLFTRVAGGLSCRAAFRKTSRRRNHNFLFCILQAPSDH